MSGAQAGGASTPVDGGVSGGARGWVGVGGSPERLAEIVFALLVVACFAALLVTQRLKHTPPLVASYELAPVIAPSSSGLSKEERIAFKLSKAETVTVTIENASEEVVATLVRDLPVKRYKTVSLRWNGHLGMAARYRILRRADGYTTLLPANRGRLAVPGEYTVRLSLRKEGRTVPLPRTFKLVGP